MYVLSKRFASDREYRPIEVSESFGVLLDSVQHLRRQEGTISFFRIDGFNQKGTCCSRWQWANTRGWWQYEQDGQYCPIKFLNQGE